MATWLHLGRGIGRTAALVLLAGCGLGEPPPPPPPRPPPRAARPLPLPPPPPPAPPPSVSVVAPPDLAGASAARLDDLLGSPDERAASGPGERWRYRAEGCVLDLFLFPDVATGRLIVLDRRAQGAEESACVRRLQAARGR